MVVSSKTLSFKEKRETLNLEFGLSAFSIFPLIVTPLSKV
jgi:hypothetical protein